MPGCLEHGSPLVRDSAVHQAAQECCLPQYSAKLNARDVFSWVQDLAENPEIYRLARRASETAKQRWLHHPDSLSCACMLINGKYESSLSQLPEGIVAMSLREARTMFPAFIQTYRADQPLAFLNAVCSQDDGVVLYVPDGMQLCETLRIRHVCTTLFQDDHVMYSPRVILIVGRHASCRVLFSHHKERNSGESVSSAIVNGLIELYVSEGAELTCTMEAQCVHEERVSWSQLVTVHERGSCSLHQDLLGGMQGYGWFDNRFHLIGEHAYAESLVSILSPKKTWVNNLMLHDAASTASRQTIKSILHEGDFAFEGGIHISPKGMYSDAYQRHDALLLHDDAHVSTFPRLEILTDDVKASHGATVGPLDTQQLFYMRSRGMSYEEAQAKLIEGFLLLSPSVERFPRLLACQDD